MLYQSRIDRNYLHHINGFVQTMTLETKCFVIFILNAPNELCPLEISIISDLSGTKFDGVNDFFNV